MASRPHTPAPGVLEYPAPNADHQAIIGPWQRPGHNGSRAWIFVINNPTDDALAGLPELGSPLWPHLVAFVYQLERGAGGTPHIQGYVNFGRTQKSFSFLRHASRLNTAHVEPARGSQVQNYAYCTKLDGRLGEPKFGGFDGLGGVARNGDPAVLSRPAVVALIRDKPDISRADIIDAGGLSVLVERPNIIAVTRSLLCTSQRSSGVVCYLFHGATDSGKSRLASHLFPGAFRKPPGKWWDHYAGESTVILEDFDADSTPIGDFLRVVDRYPLIIECKGGSFTLAADRFIITSNLFPVDWYPEAGTRIEAVQRRINFVVDFAGDGRSTRTIPGAQFFRGVDTPFDVPAVISDLPWANDPRPALPSIGFGQWDLYDPSAPYLPTTSPVAPVASVPSTPVATATEVWVSQEMLSVQTPPSLVQFPESPPWVEEDEDVTLPYATWEPRYPHTPRVFTPVSYTEE